MVVLVGKGREQMSPVLPLVQVMRHVIVLMPVLQGVVLVMTARRCHLVLVPSNLIASNWRPSITS